MLSFIIIVLVLAVAGGGWRCSVFQFSIFQSAFFSSIIILAFFLQFFAARFAYVWWCCSVCTFFCFFSFFLSVHHNCVMIWICFPSLSFSVRCCWLVFTHRSTEMMSPSICFGVKSWLVDFMLEVCAFVWVCMSLNLMAGIADGLIFNWVFSLTTNNDNYKNKLSTNREEKRTHRESNEQQQHRATATEQMAD